MHNLSYTHFKKMRKPKIVYVGYERLPGTERINWLVLKLFEIILNLKYAKIEHLYNMIFFSNFPSKVFSI